MKMLYGERRHAAAIYSDEDCKEVRLVKVRRLGRNPCADGKLPAWGDDSRHALRKENGWKSHRLTRWR